MAGLTPADRTHVPERHIKNKNSNPLTELKKEAQPQHPKVLGGGAGGSGPHGPGRCYPVLHGKVRAGLEHAGQQPDRLSGCVGGCAQAAVAMGDGQGAGGS